MAEIAQDSGGKGRKKMSTRIDMTPMVDLGFLLITFFVLVTTFSKPSAMDLAIPAKPDPNAPKDDNAVKQSRVLQLVLGDNDKLYWFIGAEDKEKNYVPKVKEIDFSQSENLRPEIQEGAAIIKQTWGHVDSMIVLIKPMKKSKYKNLVNLMDEVSIAKIKNYALVDFKLPDDSLLIWKGQQLGAGISK